MHHIHRQILAVEGWSPMVVTQKVENIATFPIGALEVVPRSGLRFAARAMERNFTHAPWQIGGGEVRRILEVLRRREARVLHVFFGNVAVHLLPLLEACELPIVVSFHGADVAGAIADDRYRSARERVFARADRVACRSEALAGAVHGLGCPRGKLCVVPTALPELDFVRREMPADGAIRLLQASRLVPKKGLATSLEAVAKLAEDFPGLTFTIAGAGPMEGELRALAERLGISARVTLTGFLDQSSLRERMRTAQIFLHPSETIRGDTEGVPNGLLEAMALGLPVVATRHGGIPEAIEDGVSGILCDERDADGVADAVRKLVRDPALYASIGAQGAAAANARFSRAGVGKILRELYDSLV